MNIRYKTNGDLVLLHGVADDGKSVCGAELDRSYDGPADVPACPQCLTMALAQATAVMGIARAAEHVIQGVSDGFAEAAKVMDQANDEYQKLMDRRVNTQKEGK